MSTDDAQPPLPLRSSAGVVIGGLLAGLEHAIANRPRPVTQIQEQYHEPWASAEGISVDGLDEPVEHREPPDMTGARL